mgnify:CR=1 FL=1
MIKKIQNIQIYKKTKKLNKSKPKSSYKSFYKTFFISLFVIFSFLILPKSAIYLKNVFTQNKIIINASKQNFDNTFNEKKKKIIAEKKIAKDLSIKDNIIFSDDIGVHPKDANIVNPPRLSASTIEMLFNDTKYDLKTVKETKVVNIENEIPLLPKELKNIENVKKRKELFIKIVLPLIVEENSKIRFDRKKLFIILNKNNNSNQDKEWLKSKFKEYSVKNNDLSTLKIRMDEIPVSLAIAQAAKETGWGTSRFAQEGNALFGQWTWSGDGIKPAAVDKDAKHKVARFKVLKASVKAYQRNLNTHSSYKKFRKERAIQRDNQDKLNS